MNNSAAVPQPRTSPGSPWNVQHSRRPGGLLTLGALTLVVGTMALACASRQAPLRGPPWAQSLADHAERLDSRARSVDMACLYDGRSERAQLREQLARREKEPLPSNAEARGAAHSALGLGALALGSAEWAREHLDAAWRDGFREPRVAWARGLALSQLYRERQAEAMNAREEDDQKRLEQVANAGYGAPALSLLQQGLDGKAPPEAYAAALLDFHQGQLDAALKRLEALDARQPRYFESLLLRGDVLLLRARQGWADPQTRIAAQADLKSARQVLTIAGSLSVGLPEAHLALARFEYAALGLTRSEPDWVGRIVYGEGVYQRVEKGIAALARAEQADPESPEVRRWKARFDAELNAWATREPRFPGDQLGEFIERAKHDLARNPADTDARARHAWVLIHDPNANASHSHDAIRAFEVAKELLEAPPARVPDSQFYELRGDLYRRWAEAEPPGSPEAREHRTLAIEDYRRAVPLDAYSQDPRRSLAWVLLSRGSDPTTEEGGADLEEAERLWAQLPSHDAYRWQLGGQLRIARARHRRAHGEDARPDLEEAVARFQRGLALDARNAWLHHGLGIALLEQAREAWERGGNPAALLDASEAAQVQATLTSTSFGGPRHGLGEVHAERAAHALRRGEDPTKELEAAEFFHRLGGSDPPWGQASERAGFARVLLLRQFFLLAQDGVSQPLPINFNAGISEIYQSFRDEPQQWRYEGEGLGVSARWLAAHEPEKAEAEFDRAAASFTQALEAVPRDQDTRLAFGWLLREWTVARKAARLDPEPVLARGLTLANGLLAERPKWAEALLLRAALLGTKDPTSVQARADRDAGLAANPNLKPWWKRRFAQGRAP